ncbi:MAG: glycerophosphodiester phosphodiesterase [Rhodospirillales bacterium]|nr:glycerophosphodiester phosphodiesterase [Rhodospirillales bacterium]
MSRHRQIGSGVPTVIAHRGASGSAPENTLAAMRKAAELGARWVEFDVMLCAGDVPILMHDDDVSRTTDGSGPVADISLSAIAKLDAGSWFGDRFAGEPVPTLEQTIVVLTELGLGANIEIKPSPGADAVTAREALAVVASQWPSTLPAPLISSFSTVALEVARDLAPEIPRAFLTSRLQRDWRAQSEKLKCEGLHVNQRYLTEKRTKNVLDAGYALRCYTVNDPSRAATLFGLGVDGVFSDYPERLMD